MNIIKLQTIILNALKDIKAENIRIFNTTHITSLFNYIIIASAFSERQTKAVANLIYDRVKCHGGRIIGVEGKNTGEWVLVDLEDIIVHIMQPSIRTYYQLEEIWGKSRSYIT